jgi:hypothetical protein
MISVDVRPILLQGWGVRATIEGRKSQTRRVIRPQPTKQFVFMPLSTELVGIGGPRRGWKRCPYGVPGNLLWVREAFTEVSEGSMRATSGRKYWYRADAEGDVNCHWSPSIHMPRGASRLTLRITNVRVQRVKEITRDDAIAEGIDWQKCPTYQTPPQIEAMIQGHGTAAKIDYIAGFALLWDSINAKRGYSWESNPWVWAISYEVAA